MAWTMEPLNSRAHRINVVYREARDWEQWVLLTGDRHWDNLHSDHAMQRRHLEEAKDRDAPIIDVGDFFDVMQGRHDKRRSADAVRREHVRDDYANALLEDAVRFFKPYRHQLALLIPGNHESAFKKNYGLDILGLFSSLISNGTTVHVGGYAHWLVWSFAYMAPDRKDKRQRRNMFLFHGSGGGGPVTKGVIQTNRRATYLPDADIIVTGHIHESWSVSMPRERISTQGKVFLDVQTHVQVPSYKDEWSPGSGWHVETGKPPKPIGAKWLRWYFDFPSGQVRHQIIDAT